MTMLLILVMVFGGALCSGRGHLHTRVAQEERVYPTWRGPEIPLLGAREHKEKPVSDTVHFLFGCLSRRLSGVVLAVLAAVEFLTRGATGAGQRQRR